MLSCADTEMIEASLIDPSKIDGFYQVGEKGKKTLNTELMHPSFPFGDKQIRRLDYDEFNGMINLQMSDYQVI